MWHLGEAIWRVARERGEHIAMAAINNLFRRSRKTPQSFHTVQMFSRHLPVTMGGPHGSLYALATVYPGISADRTSVISAGIINH
jgi:hypothetical protein